MTSSSPSGPRFHAPAGEIIGWTDGSVVRATGIRYARAGRYELPRPELVATEPVLATAWSPQCPQLPVPALEAVLGLTPDALGTSEDCLRLSVTRPRQIGPEPLPVMIWIHGGSYVSGAGDLKIFNAAPLAGEGVIVVNVTYRLGMLGFLGGTPGRPANLGLFDLLEALRWVQRNIAAFGGDPRNVTLFGHSAGADAVAALLVAEGAAGLFGRVILQSGPLGLLRGRQRMNRQTAAIAAKVPAGASLETLQAAEQNIGRLAQRYGLLGAMPFGPQYGFAPLPPEDQLEDAWGRSAPRCDLLTGYTREETTVLLSAVPLLERLTQWPLVGGLLRELFVKWTTRRVYGDATNHFARRQAQHAGQVYQYEVTFQAPDSGLAACHMMDLPLLFGEEKDWHGAPLLAGLPWAEVEQAARQVRALWAQFARTGRLPESGRVQSGHAGADALRFWRVRP